MRDCGPFWHPDESIGISPQKNAHTCIFAYIFRRLTVFGHKHGLLSSRRFYVRLNLELACFPDRFHPAFLDKYQLHSRYPALPPFLSLNIINIGL